MGMALAIDPGSYEIRVMDNHGLEMTIPSGLILAGETAPKEREGVKEINGRLYIPAPKSGNRLHGLVSTPLDVRLHHALGEYGLRKGTKQFELAALVTGDNNLYTNQISQQDLKFTYNKDSFTVTIDRIIVPSDEHIYRKISRNPNDIAIDIGHSHITYYYFSIQENKVLTICEEHSINSVLSEAFTMINQQEMGSFRPSLSTLCAIASRSGSSGEDDRLEASEIVRTYFTHVLNKDFITQNEKCTPIIFGGGSELFRHVINHFPRAMFVKNGGMTLINIYNEILKMHYTENNNDDAGRNINQGEADMPNFSEKVVQLERKQHYQISIPFYVDIAEEEKLLHDLEKIDKKRMVHALSSEMKRLFSKYVQPSHTSRDDEPR